MSLGTQDANHAIESCTSQIQNWRLFGRIVDSDSKKPCANHGPDSKRPCRADRATSFSVESIMDMSKLSLFDDDKPLSLAAAHKRMYARKRRRRGRSRSVSGRSSDRRCCCSVGVSAANGTCSDFLVAAGGTDSSGELFGDANWASDVSERNSRRDREGNGVGERDNVLIGHCQSGNFDSQGNESGYGSEPGYRGDVELGYDDEFDEEEDDPRALFWGGESGDNALKLERVDENNLLKVHSRCRRKKHDLRMVGTPR